MLRLMQNFLLPWLNKNPLLKNLPNNPLGKLEQISALNNPDGGFLQNKAPMTPIPQSIKPQTSAPMTPIPKNNAPMSTISNQGFPMSTVPNFTIPQKASTLPSFTDFQNQNFIPDPLKSFVPSYANQSKPKLEISSEQERINKQNQEINNEHNKKRNAMYSFMADVQKND